MKKYKNKYLKYLIIFLSVMICLIGSAPKNVFAATSQLYDEYLIKSNGNINQSYYSDSVKSTELDSIYVRLTKYWGSAYARFYGSDSPLSIGNGKCDKTVNKTLLYTFSLNNDGKDERKEYTWTPTESDMRYQYFTCQIFISDAEGSSAQYKIYTAVPEPPEFKDTMPAEIEIDYGQTVPLTATASGNPTYTWQIGNSQGGYFSPITTNEYFTPMGNTLNIRATNFNALNGKYIRCHASNDDGSADTTPVKIKIVNASPTIIANLPGKEIADESAANSVSIFNENEVKQYGTPTGFVNGEITIGSVTASFPYGTPNWIWMVRTKSGLGYSAWTPVANFPDKYTVTGADTTSTSLIVHNLSTDDDGSQFYVKALSGIDGVKDTVSKVTQLTVYTALPTEISVYPKKTVYEVNEKITSDDFVVIALYQDSKSLVYNGELGLTNITDPGGSMVPPQPELYLCQLGEKNIQVRLKDYPSIPASTAIIQVKDTKSPEISNISVLDSFTGVPVVASNNPDKRVLLKISATDNFSTRLQYSLQKYRDGFFETIKDFAEMENPLYELTKDNGNGRYKIVAKDEAGNATSQEVTVSAWDLDAPIITVTVSDEDTYTPSKNLCITAHDGVAGNTNLASSQLKYFIEKADAQREIQDNEWKDVNSCVVTENGLFFVYVKDQYGNVSCVNKSISKIDNLPPVVSVKVSKKNNKTALISICAEDDTSGKNGSGYSGLKLNEGIVDCFTIDPDDVTLELPQYEQNSKKYYTFFTSTKDGHYTLTTSDMAGNETISDITWNIREVLRQGGDEPNIILGFDCQNTDFVSTYPDWTSTAVSITALVEEGITLPSNAYCWDYEDYVPEEPFNGTGSWTSSPSKTVTENGKYTVYVRDADNLVYAKSIEITNIDNTAPNIVASIAGGAINFTASDGDSGIKNVIVDGGSLDTIHEFKYSSGMENVNETFKVSKNGNYKVYAIDVAGNKSDSVTKTINSIIEEDKYFTVQFMDGYNDSILKSQTVYYGEDATPPVNPKREGYTFTGWDKSYTNVKTSLNINALWLTNASDNVYTVLFKNFDGSILKSQAVAAGKDATPPSSPQRTGYKFTGWDNSYSNIQSDTVCTALYVEAPKTVQNISGITGNSGLQPTISTEITPAPAMPANATGSGITGGYSGTGSTGTTTSKVGEKINGTDVDENSTNESETNETITDEESESVIEDIIDDVTEDVPENYVNLADFSNEAKLLAVSAYDENGNGQTIQNQEDIVNELFDEEMSEGDETQAVEETKKTNGKAVASIIFLIALGAATAFYFLNKKYYWVALPF